jgi:hypothetical protein
MKYLPRSPDRTAFVLFCGIYPKRKSAVQNQEHLTNWNKKYRAELVGIVGLFTPSNGLKRI